MTTPQPQPAPLPERIETALAWRDCMSGEDLMYGPTPDWMRPPDYRALLVETAAALAAAQAREAQWRAALDAAIQCEQDVIDAYGRGAPMVVLDEAVADLKRDSLPHLKRARAALGDQS
ncbi:hypothetical protein GCM10008959_26030 [Deinococcus seoulensis]|uniref:Uncharacterized protein n=1 Tax=Deinococcus seoulensis TaxID=1837379 RepID=A0ABQ2RX18_9DEIO|nr:hypothetical protein [Deinococcus seoulensis]GGR62777.1 hypothetical protein GCM10008959_26030 [Deinococcus seoulensis]